MPCAIRLKHGWRNFAPLPQATPRRNGTQKTVKIPCEKTICGEDSPTQSFLGTTQKGRLNLRLEYRRLMGFWVQCYWAALCSQGTGYQQRLHRLHVWHLGMILLDLLHAIFVADQPFRFTVIKGGSCLTQAPPCRNTSSRASRPNPVPAGFPRLITNNLTTQMQEFGHTMSHLWHVTCHPCVSWKKPRRWPFRIPAWHTLVPTLVRYRRTATATDPNRFGLLRSRRLPWLVTDHVRPAGE